MLELQYISILFFHDIALYLCKNSPQNTSELRVVSLSAPLSPRGLHQLRQLNMFVLLSDLVSVLFIDLMSDNGLLVSRVHVKCLHVCSWLIVLKS